MSDQLSPVNVYVQSHRDMVQADFHLLAQLSMGMLPVKNDIIDVTPYVLPDTDLFFDPDRHVLRVDGVYIRYERHEGLRREVVAICGTPITRPRFF